MRSLKPEIEGIDKARAALLTLAANPPKVVAIGVPMRICTDLYAEIREARCTGHTWPTIRDAIHKATGVRMAESTLIRNFYILEESWSKKTGIPPLPKTGNNPYPKNLKKGVAA